MGVRLAGIEEAARGAPELFRHLPRAGPDRVEVVDVQRRPVPPCLLGQRQRHGRLGRAEPGARRRLGTANLLEIAERLPEDLCRQRATKESLVKRRDDAVRVLGPHDEAQIDRRRPLRDHPHGRETDRTKHVRRNSRAAAHAFPDQADERHLTLDLHARESRQRGNDLGEPAVVVNREGDRHLGGGYQVDGRPMHVEHFEDPRQESVRHQHPRRGDVDHGDPALVGDRLHHPALVRRGRGTRDDRRPAAVRAPGVPDPDRHPRLDGG